MAVSAGGDGIRPKRMERVGYDVGGEGCHRLVHENDGTVPPRHCWKVSARPSARLPLKSNLSVVPAGRSKALGRPRSLQCNKTVLLLVLLVKLQSYDVWIAGKIIAQT